MIPGIHIISVIPGLFNEGYMYPIDTVWCIITWFVLECRNVFIANDSWSILKHNLLINSW